MISKPANILILGAGMAGLAAGQYLLQKGFQVTLLEANSHIGGRTFTDSSLGVPLDLGAAWIHGTEANPIANLAQQCHIALKSTEFIHFDQALLFDSSGHKPLKEILRLDAAFDKLLERANQLALTAEHDLSLGQMLECCIKQSEFRFPADYLSWRFERLSGYMGAGPYKLSARHWNQDKVLPGGNFLLLNGYKPIIDYLATHLTIELNTPITKIKLNQDNVEVFSHQKKYLADAVICTFPLGVLKKGIVEFDPKLPDKKQRAIENIGMGLLNKIALKFSQSFWPQEVDLISYFKNKYDNFSGFVNYAYYFNQPILVGYSGGDLASEIEKKSDLATIAHTMKLLREFFGKKIPEPIASKITRWGQNPFSFGSYSYLSVGATANEYDELAKSIDDKLFFAGEATHHDFPATTHGAYLSGIREAEKICNIMI